MGGMWYKNASSSVLFCFDTVWNRWTAPKVTGDIPLPRMNHSACVWKNYMYIMGGCEKGLYNFVNTVYALDLHKMHWTFIRTTGELQIYYSLYSLSE